MNELTIQHYLKIIRLRGKNHWRSRFLIRKMNEHITGLRLLAKEKKGTHLARFCNGHADYLEKELEVAQNYN